MPSPVVIVLAAGRAERFRSSGASMHKLDARLNRRSVLDHTLRAVEASGLAWHLVRPAGGTGGMGESIALGIRATADAPGWLILPGDLPLIQPVSLQHIAAGLQEQPLVVPHYRQQQGHPVAFGREFLPALLALTGDTGAREIVKAARREQRVLELALNDYGIVHDIDTLHDLEVARRLLAWCERFSPGRQALRK